MVGSSNREDGGRGQAERSGKAYQIGTNHGRRRGFHWLSVPASSEKVKKASRVELRMMRATRPLSAP
jgi:hypothetical protein